MIIKPGVYDDLAAAYLWYEDIQAGLGQRLLDDFEELVSKIDFAPTAYRVVYRNYRRARMDVFPYYVHYQIDKDAITIMSVDHTSRNPREWKRRVKARS